MVQPERPPEQRRRTQAPRSALILATVFVVILGVLVVGGLTSPGPQPGTEATTTTDVAFDEPTTTTTSTTLDPSSFRVSDLQTGASVLWVRGFGVGDTSPVALTSHDGVIYLFGETIGPRGSRQTTGLQAWISTDAIFWSELGTVIGPEHVVDNVVSTDQGLLALSRRAVDGSPVIWRSSNGSDWTPEELPVPRELRPSEQVELFTAAAGGGRTLVFGTITLDTDRLLIDYLPDQVLPAQESGYGFDIGWFAVPPLRIDIRGPWGITAYTATSDDLGIPDDVELLLSFGQPSEMFTWVSEDDESWQMQTFDADWIEEAQVGEDGTVTVTGYGTQGPMMWTSTDGLLWESANRPEEIEYVVQWAEGFAGIKYRGSLGTDVVRSDDGIVWEQLGVNDLLPDFIAWDYGPMAAGRAGIATFVNGHNPSTPFNPGNPDPTLEKDGFRLTLDDQSGMLELIDLASGDRVIFFSVYSSVISPLIEVDFETREVTFLDPDVEEPLVSFGFQEMEAAQQSAYQTGYAYGPGLRVLFFSADGNEWSIQDMSETFGNDWVWSLLIADDKIVAITLDAFYYDRVAPRVSTWMGIIP